MTPFILFELVLEFCHLPLFNYGVFAFLVGECRLSGKDCYRS